MNKKIYENVKTLRTTNRRLENFLYVLGVMPLYHEKEWDGSTVWVYEDTPELRSLVKDFQNANERRKRMLNGA